MENRNSKAHYLANRQKLEVAANVGLPILDFGGYEPCNECPQADHDTRTDDEEDFGRVICGNPACPWHRKKTTGGKPEMTDRILFRAHANENTIDIRTYSPRMKSPQYFYICYDEFDRLRENGYTISSDIHSFAKLQLDEKHDRITFDFTWLTGCGSSRVEGTEQRVELRWSEFQEFLNACRQPNGPKKFKASSLGPRLNRPKLIFDGNRENLKAAISNKTIRHKLGKALAAHFNWPDADEIYLFNDFVPYSFFFREFRDGQPRICGGLILHGQGNMAKAHYEMHT